MPTWPPSTHQDVVDEINLKRDAAWETFVYKTADENVTSSTVLQDDDQISFAVGAGEQWVFEATLLVNGPTAGDIQIAFTAPSGTVSWMALGLDPASTTNIASVVSDGAAGSGLPITFGVNNSRISMILVKGYVAPSASGTVRLQWAQAVSNGTATQMRAGTLLTARRVA